MSCIIQIPTPHLETVFKHPSFINARCDARALIGNVHQYDLWYKEWSGFLADIRYVETGPDTCST